MFFSKGSDMSASTPKPKRAAPVVVLREEPSDPRRYLFMFVPAVIGSVVFHIVLVAAFFACLFFSVTVHADDVKLEPVRENVVEAENVELSKNFDIVDEDPAAVEFDAKTNYAVERKAE